MSRITVYAALALVLSVAGVASVVFKPLPPEAPPAPQRILTQGPVTVDARLSHGAVPSAGTQQLYAEVTVKADGEQLPKIVQPISLALVLDTSGSMGGEKMTQARAASHRLVDLLDERDELSFITFSDGVEASALLLMTADNRASAHRAIDEAMASGSTNLSGGVERAEQTLRHARGARRMVVVSDGRPTMGLLTSEALTSLVGRVHDEGITVTALGVGDDYDGVLMQRLAERGGGMYGYLKEASTLNEVLELEVAAARAPSLRNVVLTLSGEGLWVAESPGRMLSRVSGATVLHLADLRPGRPTTVLVRLTSGQQRQGQPAQLGVSLSWSGVSEGVVTGALPVLTIDDAQAVERARDEAMFARGISAMGTQHMVAAAAAYERGDSAGARALLNNARALFEMSADALSGAAVEKMEHDFGHASHLQRKSMARDFETKSLKNFGRDNEAY